MVLSVRVLSVKQMEGREVCVPGQSVCHTLEVDLSVCECIAYIWGASTGPSVSGENGQGLMACNGCMHITAEEHCKMSA